MKDIAGILRERKLAEWFSERYPESSWLWKIMSKNAVTFEGVGGGVLAHNSPSKVMHYYYIPYKNNVKPTYPPCIKNSYLL
jgi:hypothetical protein